jgi:outer membrane protein OmpA-like peptidoglycan-associated protein
MEYTSHVLMIEQNHYSGSYKKNISMKKIIITSVFALILSIGYGFGQTKTVFDSADFLVVPLESLNTIASDMSPCQVGNQLYYSSVRKPWWESQHRLKKNMVFYNQYMVPLSEAGQIINGVDRKLVAGLGENYHQGPVSYCAKTGELFVTVSNTNNPDSVQQMIVRADIRLRLIIMKNKSGVWEKTEEMPFNDKRYHFAHPAISVTGDTLIFSSDMPGGKGKSDLYMSIRKSGHWNIPSNLGDTVNTSGNEMYPTFLPGGLLSFASDGHQSGKGSLDICYTTFPVITEVKNAGDKINTQFDDFGLIINPNLNVGYLCSNRQAKGSDDIFRVDVKWFMSTLKIVCYDFYTKKALPATNVELRDSNGKSIEVKVTSNDGSVDFLVESLKKYQIYAENATYVPLLKDVNIKNSVSDLTQTEDLFLKIAASYLTINVIDKDSKQTIPNAMVQIAKGKYDESQISKDSGSVRMKLNESTNYTFVASAEKYFEKTALFSSENKGSGEYTLTIEIEKLEVGKQIVLEDLYYDVNKYNIRPDAAVVLDKLVKLLNENPDINIEVGSHTDCRAPADYNLRLSQNRSESVVNYLVSKGISRTRLVPKGYGESRLVNKCADGVPCTEEEHQANRRTVIEILNPGTRKVKRGNINSLYYF